MWMCWHDGIEEEDTIQTYRILETPFNWKGYDKLFWWGKREQEVEKEVVEPASIDLKKMIDNGENNNVHFTL